MRKQIDEVYCSQTAKQKPALVPGLRSRHHHASLAGHPAYNMATVCHLCPDSTIPSAASPAAYQQVGNRQRFPSPPAPHSLGQSALVFLIPRLNMTKRAAATAVAAPNQPSAELAN
jgi:hypothetical protein